MIDDAIGRMAHSWIADLFAREDRTALSEIAGDADDYISKLNINQGKSAVSLEDLAPDHPLRENRRASFGVGSFGNRALAASSNASRMRSSRQIRKQSRPFSQRFPKEITERTRAWINFIEPQFA